MFVQTTHSACVVAMAAAASANEEAETEVAEAAEVAEVAEVKRPPRPRVTLLVFLLGVVEITDSSSVGLVRRREDVLPNPITGSLSSNSNIPSLNILKLKLLLSISEKQNTHIRINKCETEIKCKYLPKTHKKNEANIAPYKEYGHKSQKLYHHVLNCTDKIQMSLAT